MLKVIFYLLIFIFFHDGLLATTLFEKGNEFYKKGEYEKAISIYEEVIKKGYVGESIFYNLGNAYYREGKIGKAILNYEKALKYSPNDEDILHNLALVNLKTKDKLETLPKFFLFQWWEGILSTFSLFGWTVLVYLIYLILLISIGTYLLLKRQNIQKLAFYTGIFSLLMLLLTTSIMGVKLNRELKDINGIILQNSVDVKLSPDPGSSEAFIIPEGLKVRIEDKVGEWVRIRLIDGKVGWVTESVFQII